MEYGNVLTETDGDLLIVTLHWPERHNALSHGMRVDLLDCVRRAETDAAVKAIVITGHGDKSFSAGANIPELEQRTPVSEMGPPATLRKDLPTAIERLGKPTVAAINGYCLGAGLELAMGCTIRIASENALLGQPEIALGQIPGSGGTQRLYRFVGLGWAMQMVLTGQRIDARTARVHRAGHRNRGAGGPAAARAKALARDMGSRAPMAFVAGRDAVLRSTETDLLTGIDYERKLYALCMGTEDAREGMRAYAEKRAPEYKGR